MKKIILLFLSVLMTISLSAHSSFVKEHALKDSLLGMLARFTQYVSTDYQDIDEKYGCFRGENTMGSDERGVRTNADLSMVCAFLSHYAQGKVKLPHPVTWQRIDSIAYKSLSFALDTHKAVHLRTCRDKRYWGSVSKKDHQWESSLWALSVAYSAFFQWNKLSSAQKDKLYRLLKAECNYELERDIPTGYQADTKAEENGWEVGVLAAAIGLFPNDSLASHWFERMRAFAINSYSHPSDATNNKVIDPWFDSKTVADLYQGANLYEDWTLQNHGFFHTSYQNVVIQELGEAALALRLFQGEHIKWKSNALLHNCDQVTKNVLNWLTLPDGEQAMPNGNDWSLFLYDQLTSYSTMACMLRDVDALYFENQAYKQIRHRQLTTSDGSWLLRPDVGGRRMGVQSHRVMMSWLMHEMLSTSEMQPTVWSEFQKRHAEAKFFPCQRIVRTLTKNYFACFSWSEGKNSYTGYIAPLDLSNNNLVVPFRKFNTGNLLGYIQLQNKNINARPIDTPHFMLQGNYFQVKGLLIENDSTLKRSFTLTSNGHGLDYRDEVLVLRDTEIQADRTGMIAISTDAFTCTEREIYQKKGKTSIDGLLEVKADTPLSAEIGDGSVENSINTIKVYPFAKSEKKKLFKGERLHHRVNFTIK